MPARSASEDARKRAYVAGNHIFCPKNKDVDGTGNSDLPESGTIKVPQVGVNPTCGDKPGHDVQPAISVNTLFWKILVT